MEAESVSINFTIEIPLDKEKEWKAECQRNGDVYLRADTVSQTLKMFNEMILDQSYDEDLRYYEFDNGVSVSFIVEQEPVIDHEIKRRQDQAEKQLKKLSESLNMIGGQINRIVMDSARIEKDRALAYITKDMRRPRLNDYKREVYDGAHLAEWYEKYFKDLEKYTDSLEAKMAVRSISVWNEDIGPALWWDTLEAAKSEAAQWIGSPVDTDWPIFLQTTDAVFIPHPNINFEKIE